MGNDTKRELRMDDSGLGGQVIAAAWAAFRTGQVTWLTDRLGPIAAIVPAAMAQGSLAGMTPAEVHEAHHHLNELDGWDVPEPDDDEDLGPQDDDGYVTLDRDRYYVSLGSGARIVPDGQPSNGYPDRKVAIYELAALMARYGEFPGAWVSGEHGPATADISDEVRAFHDEGGTALRPLANVRFEPGAEVRAWNGGIYTVIRDYGELGTWLHVAGDPSQELFVADASTSTPLG